MSTCYDDKMKERSNSLKREKAQERIDEIEDILLEMPFTDPEFEKLVIERNNLSIIVN